MMRPGGEAVVASTPGLTNDVRIEIPLDINQSVNLRDAPSAQGLAQGMRPLNIDLTLAHKLVVMRVGPNGEVSGVVIPRDWEVCDH